MTNKNSDILRKMSVTAMLIALGVVLPMAFHSVPQGGMIFLPMHIPVLLCGLLSGYPYGLACGILTPLISSLITSMPPPAMLPQMLCELAVYGFVAGLLMGLVRTKKLYPRVFVALIGAMLAGRVAYGLLNAMVLQGGSYSLEIWLGAAFVTAVPGIAIQLVLIPALVLALDRALGVSIAKKS
ncbi:MAG: ECF transporter S component [Oscillospiraceae bacterium]|nr:ECF transporter S component [Oscillospiraceae bacterium]